jgi:drug/metabolite transporter (DMT)-like permease
LCCAAWGVNQVALKVANEGISPLFQAGIRCALATVLLAIWATWRGIPLFKRDGSFWPGLAVGALFAGNFMFIGPGLALTDASRGVLFLYATPFLVAVAAHFIIPGDRLTGLKLIGLVAAFAGLALSTGGRSAGMVSPNQALGDFYCFVAALFWAATTLVVRRTSLKALAPEKVLFYQLVVAAPMLIFGAWLIGEAGFINVQPITLTAFAFSTVVVVFVSYVAWFWLLQHYPISDVSAFTFLAPIFGVLAGYLLLNEPISWQLGAALALVASGIALVARPTAKERAV